MSRHKPHHDEPLDLATIAADDLLLDALGRGAARPEGAEPTRPGTTGGRTTDAAATPAGTSDDDTTRRGGTTDDDTAGGDDLTVLLAAWRAELDADPPAAARDAELLRALGTEPEPATTARPRAPWLGRRLIGAAAAVIAVAGLAIGTQHAGPTSPLWPIAKVMYPQQAEAREAAYAIQRARTAAAAGRNDEARRLLEEARAHLARVTDPALIDRLRADLDTALRDLPTVESPAPAVEPTGAPAPVGTPATGAVPPPPVPTGGIGTDPTRPAPRSPAPGPRVVPETAPTLPIPPPPLPGPSTVASPLPGLPGLPLPTGRLLR
ncbi:hypothetical protein SAMN05444365_10989 [Micromonospora pattaloongensis]|uniref:Anti-sigma-D factor RsdA to sigma factor binding region n=1 Tax=Micromonospora pattaloongensis TaxID=405436 RepID=A0A1H3RVB8_9ACTN|nr:hypothetical protein [Micromonospora pattaloongensis]SDZ29255.1 hypothetical protein SAMN05444365_10989 [Micromonospora pattaloongensis]